MIHVLKKIVILLVCALGILDAKIYKIGFAQDTLANDWRKAQVDEAIETVKKYDFLELSVTDAKGSVARQIMDIENFIEKQYDFILTSPIEPKITPLVLSKAIEKGIKVILIDRGVNTDDYTAFIAPDNYQIATEAAQYLLGKIHYQGTVLMLQGIEGATPTQLRGKGFEDIAKKYQDIKIIKRRANFLRNDAIEVMEDMYHSEVHFDAIYSHSDSMLVGARMVMEQKNIKVPMVGIDYIKEAKEAILKEHQLASFTYPTCAKEGIETIVKIIEGKRVEKNSVIKTELVDKNNASRIHPIF